MAAPPRSTYPGLFVLAGSVILLQVALTRVFAIMLWHHLTYMVVSIALLGFGAAGSLLTVRRRPVGEPASALAGWSAAYGLLAVAALALARQVPVDSLQLWSEAGSFGSLLLLYLIVTAPFLAGGVAVGLALTLHVRAVDRLYSADLAGSAAGGAASVALLSLHGGAATVVLAGAAGLLAAFLFSLGGPARTRRLGLVALAGALLLALLFTGAGARVGLPHLRWDVPFAPGKEMRPWEQHEGLLRLHGPTAQVEVSPQEPMWASMGGEIGLLSQQVVPSRLLTQDGTAPTMIFDTGGDLQAMPFLTAAQAASAHVARAARGAGPAGTLVIGVGGGVDVLVALAHGARAVTAVEINAGMIEAVTGPFADELGGLFTGGHPLSPRVRLVHGEGRSWLAASDERFDVIQLSGVDSFTALSTGAYTLSESYLYTTEAVADFYAHLEEGGILCYSRFILTYPKKPRETLRLAGIARTALDELGVERPEAHIAVLQGGNWASTMVRKGPFTEGEVAALERFADEHGFLGLVFDPRHPEGVPDTPERRRQDLQRIVTMSAVGELRKAAPAGLPYGELSDVVRHVAAAMLARLDGDEAGALAQVETLAARHPPARRGEVAAFAASLVQGGFPREFLEARVDGLARMRRDYATLVAGDAGERARFLAAYEHDLSPCTDDRPFFFNYYRYGQLVDRLLGRHDPAVLGYEIYHPDFPVGHMVLLSSLVQIAALAALLLFLPLRRLGRRGLDTGGSWRVFAYFAALGLGFMFVEIVLMQKLVIVLGHPTYAVSVVLASLLLSAGGGSLLSGRFRRLDRPALLRLGALVAGLVVAEAVALELLAPALLALPFAGRVAASVALVAPLGVALGTAFPTGLKIVGSRCPHLLPWCWAVNGFLSVFSGMLCIVLGMFVGFTAVLLLAAAIYAVGFALMLPERREAEAEAERPPSPRPERALA